MDSTRGHSRTSIKVKVIIRLITIHVRSNASLKYLYDMYYLPRRAISGEYLINLVDFPSLRLTNCLCEHANHCMLNVVELAGNADAHRRPGTLPLMHVSVSVPQKVGSASTAEPPARPCGDGTALDTTSATPADCTTR